MAAVSHYHDQITDRCSSLFNNTWKSICSGSYPMNIKLKYGGKLVVVGEPYSVFQKESEPSHMLVIFRKTGVNLCRTLNLMHMNIFKCVEGNGNSYIIETRHSHVICVNYHFRMADELISYCTTEQIAENQFVSLYYSELDGRIREIIQGNSAKMMNANVVMLAILAAILIILFLHCK